MLRWGACKETPTWLKRCTVLAKWGELSLHDFKLGPWRFCTFVRCPLNLTQPVAKNSWLCVYKIYKLSTVLYYHFQSLYYTKKRTIVKE